MYRFKPWAELGWAVAIAASTVVLLELAGLNPDGVTDWRDWAFALAVAAIRAGAGAALDWIRRSLTDPADDDPTEPLVEQILALSPEDRARLAATLEQHRLIRERMGDMG